MYRLPGGIRRQLKATVGRQCAAGQTKAIISDVHRMTHSEVDPNVNVRPTKK